MKAALYVLHYIHSTHDFGITFSSRPQQPIHMYLHQPDASDIEAFTDAVPLKKGREHHLITYIATYWGSQMGNAIPHGVTIPLFKFQNMSDDIFYRMGGHILWKAIHQEQTSLSSCEAKILATNKGGKITVAVRNLSNGFTLVGTPIPDNLEATLVYNDNEAAVNLSNTTTMKNVRHLELCDKATREWAQNGIIKVLHLTGKCNPSDIFTEEMKDGAHFRRLCDSLICRLSKFNCISWQLDFQLHSKL